MNTNKARRTAYSTSTLALGLSVLSLAWNSHAQIFSSGEVRVAPGLGLIQDQLSTQINLVVDELNTQVGDVNLNNMLSQTADSFVDAGVGVGVDYSSNFSVALLGGKAGVGAPSISQIRTLVNSDEFRIADVPGAGLTGGVIVGTQLGLFTQEKIGFLDLAKMKVFLSFLPLSMDFGPVSFSATHFGLHGQYKLIDPIGWGWLAKWGGVDVTTGLRYAGGSVSFKQTLNVEDIGSTTIVPGTTATGEYSGDLNLSLEGGTWTLPIDVSSQVKVLSWLVFFGGLGVDINLGGFSANVDSEGNIEMRTDTAIPGGGVDGDSQLAATAPITAANNQSQGPSFMHLRGSFGTQFDFGVFALNLAVNKSFFSNGFGVTAGTHFYW